VHEGAYKEANETGKQKISMHPMALANTIHFLLSGKQEIREFAGAISCFPDSNKAYSTADFRINAKIKSERFRVSV
jgi:hypothetical protein